MTWKKTGAEVLTRQCRGIIDTFLVSVSEIRYFTRKASQ